MVGQAGAQALDLQAVQDSQDAEFVVQGEEFVEGAAGSAGGQVRALAGA